MRLLIAAAVLAGAVLALVILAVMVGLAACPGQAPDQQQQRFAQWEQCELNSGGSGGASDPCGPMPVP